MGLLRLLLAFSVLVVHLTPLWGLQFLALVDNPIERWRQSLVLRRRARISIAIVAVRATGGN
jgi:hypothetical protein